MNTCARRKKRELWKSTSTDGDVLKFCDGNCGMQLEFDWSRIVSMCQVLLPRFFNLSYLVRTHWWHDAAFIDLYLQLLFLLRLLGNVKCFFNAVALFIFCIFPFIMHENVNVLLMSRGLHFSLSSFLFFMDFKSRLNVAFSLWNYQVHKCSFNVYFPLWCSYKWCFNVTSLSFWLSTSAFLLSSASLHHFINHHCHSCLHLLTSSLLLTDFLSSRFHFLIRSSQTKIAASVITGGSAFLTRVSANYRPSVGFLASPRLASPNEGRENEESPARTTLESF